MSDKYNGEQVLGLSTTTALQVLADATGRPVGNGFIPLFDYDTTLHRLLPHANFMQRTQAEEDPSFKQLIPYIVLTYEGQVLSYRRGNKGQEDRLKGQVSIGVGGHVNPEGDVIGAPAHFAFGIQRELFEEVNVFPHHIKRQHCIGFVNDDSNPVGRVHLGVVYVVELRNTDGLIYEDTMVDPAWCDPAIFESLSMLETWSAMIVEHVTAYVQKLQRAVEDGPNYAADIADEASDVDYLARSVNSSAIADGTVGTSMEVVGEVARQITTEAACEPMAYGSPEYNAKVDQTDADDDLKGVELGQPAQCSGEACESCQ